MKRTTQQRQKTDKVKRYIELQVERKFEELKDELVELLTEHYDSVDELIQERLVGAKKKQSLREKMEEVNGKGTSLRSTLINTNGNYSNIDPINEGRNGQPIHTNNNNVVAPPRVHSPVAEKLKDNPYADLISGATVPQK